MYEADLSVSVVSFISSSMGQMRSTKSPNLELCSERTSYIQKNAKLKDRASFFLNSCTYSQMAVQQQVPVWLQEMQKTREEGSYYKSQPHLQYDVLTVRWLYSSRCPCGYRRYRGRGKRGRITNHTHIFRMITVIFPEWTEKTQFNMIFIPLAC